MRKIANVFLNGVEVSAQEASYGVLGIPLTNSSRDCIFIPTGPPEERIIFVKTENELRNLILSLTDIGARGLLDHYVQRPDAFHAARICCMVHVQQQEVQTKRTGNK
jgi:hypothetical protein